MFDLQDGFCKDYKMWLIDTVSFRTLIFNIKNRGGRLLYN